jgi:dTDP-4-amino-4,6-dideoxygalactose transaminase
VICHVGATPVLVDLAAGSYQMDLDALAAALSPRSKAIITVDLAGVMCDYDAIRRMLATPLAFRKFEARPGTMQELFTRLPIIADSAHAFGATYKGRPSGSVADFTVFSFHAVKNLTTAEGGALTWRGDIGGAQLEGSKPGGALPEGAQPGGTQSSGTPASELLYERAKLYALHGQTKDALAKTQAGAWEYDVVAPLYKCNMTDISAALGLAQLARYPQMLERRRELIALYGEGLDLAAKAGGYQLDILAHDDGRDSISSGHLMMVRLLGRDDDFRRRFIVGMAQRGVACNVHFKPLPLLSAYAVMGFDIANYPNAFRQYENQVSLPLHTNLSNDDVAYVCQCFAQAYAECAGER